MDDVLIKTWKVAPNHSLSSWGFKIIPFAPFIAPFGYVTGLSRRKLFQLFPQYIVQGGPLPVISGVKTPINGLING